MVTDRVRRHRLVRLATPEDRTDDPRCDDRLLGAPRAHRAAVIAYVLSSAVAVGDPGRACSSRLIAYRDPLPAVISGGRRARSNATIPEVWDLVGRERDRQRSTLNLIASENTAPASVHEALGSVFGNKTAEGYPGRRYHRGNAVTDELETLAIERAKAVFGADHANVQVHAGVNANLAVYQAVLQAWAIRVIALDLSHGGHLSHGASASITSRILDMRHYGVRPDTEQIDLDDVRDAGARAPAADDRDRRQLVPASASTTQGSATIADEVGALVLVDMAHIAGLVAADVLPEPGPACGLRHVHDVQDAQRPAWRDRPVSRPSTPRRSTGRCSRAPRARPSVSQIAAKAVALHLATTPAFREVQARTVRQRPGPRRGAGEALGSASSPAAPTRTRCSSTCGRRGSPATSPKSGSRRPVCSSTATSSRSIPATTLVTSGIRVGTPGRHRAWLRRRRDAAPGGPLRPRPDAVSRTGRPTRSSHRCRCRPVRRIPVDRT